MTLHLEYHKPEPKRSRTGILAIALGVGFWALWFVAESHAIRVSPHRLAFVTLGGFITGTALAAIALWRQRKSKSGWLAMIGLIVCLLGAATVSLAIGLHLLFSGTW